MIVRAGHETGCGANDVSFHVRAELKVSRSSSSVASKSRVISARKAAQAMNIDANGEQSTQSQTVSGDKT